MTSSDKAAQSTPPPQTTDSSQQSLPGGAASQLGELSYEQARAALDAVVNLLESSTVDLETSLALWERGNALAEVCQGYLDGARARIAAVRPDLISGTQG